jgi:membrane-associated phospholipid phosphatase
VGLLGPLIIAASLLGGLSPPPPIIDLSAVRFELPAAPLLAQGAAANAPLEWVAPDFRQFPRVLGWNFTRGLFSKPNILPFVAGAGGALIVSNWDEEISNKLRDDDGGFGQAGYWVGRPLVSMAAVGTLLVATPFTDNAKFRSFSFTMAQSLIVDNVLVHAAKLAVGRERPDGSSDQSFYSGHTSNSFMWAAAIEDHFGWKAGIPAYVVASLVGVSRVTSGSHWASDVIFGAAMGIISGKTAGRGTRHSVGDREIAVLPILGRGHRGVSVRIAFE